MINKRNFISSIFYLRQKELKKSKSEKKYLRLELCNKSKRIFGYLWTNFEIYYETLHFNSVLKIEGELKSFNKKQIIEISSLEVITKNTSAILESFVSNENQEWFSMQKAILPENYQELLKKIYSIDRLTQFFIIPSGKLWAFHTESGLFKKTKNTIDLLHFFDGKGINIALIKLALFLQAIGFIEGTFTDYVFDYKRDARFLGIPILALSIVSSYIDESKLSETEKSHLKHLILMHPSYAKNDEANWKSMESMILYKTLDLTILENALNEIKGQNKDRQWSNYNKLLERYLFLE